MSVAERWIVIPNWAEFQHYKERDPKWIKNYTRLLNDAEYRALNGRLRGILHGLWLLYAASDGHVPGSPAYIASQLGVPTEREARKREGALTVRGRSADRALTSRGQAADTDADSPLTLRDLRRLEQAGFLTLTASKPLALRYQRASPEAEKYLEKEEGPTSKTDAQTANGQLDPEKSLELARILGELRGVDQTTYATLAPLAGQVPLAVLADLRTRCTGKGPGWIVRALKAEIKERRAA